jgi:hypothetical protein
LFFQTVFLSSNQGEHHLEDFFLSLIIVKQVSRTENYKFIFYGLANVIEEPVAKMSNFQDLIISDFESLSLHKMLLREKAKMKKHFSEGQFTFELMLKLTSASFLTFHTFISTKYEV